MTKEERIKNDPLAQVILQITHAMKTDFGAQYKKQFANDEDLRLYKRRLYTKLIDSSVPDIIDGYEAYIESGKTFCPTIPELITNIEAAKKDRLRKEANNREVQRVAALPAPKVVECNPLAMLAEAKDKAGTVSKADILKNHEAVITLAGDKIRRVDVLPVHCCAVGFCQKPGVLSRATVGNGDFFCKEHFRQTG
jgi:hypothetical protein